MQTLPDWMAWATGGGAGVIVWLVVALLEKRPGFAAWWNGLQPEVKRIGVFAVASALGGLLFWGQTALGYVPPPGNLAGWFEAVFAIVVSQVVYAGAKAVGRAVQ